MAMAGMLMSSRWRAKEGTRKWMGTSTSDPAVQNTTWRGQGRVAWKWDVLPLHGCHGGILSNTCRATTWMEWDAYLGLVRAEFGHGPKMKFAKLGLLYISGLRVMVIRVVD